MGVAGRIVCIFTPYVLTIASLICIILVGLGCTDKHSGTLNDLYFFRADLQNLTLSSSAQSSISNALSAEGVNASSSDLSSLLNQAKNALQLKDFYDVGLFGYCDGNVTKNNFDTTYCSKAKAAFWFNPVEVWGLNGTGVENVLPKNLQNDLNMYKAVSKWMFVAYIVAFASTVLELLVGLTAICGRLGSCITTLVSSVSLLFIIAASVTSTVLFAVVKDAFNKNLNDYGIKGTMGHSIYVTTWLAVAFSLAASVFWMLSSCCCSGKSDRNRRVTVEKAPYTYERVGDAFAHGANQQPTGHNVPMQNMKNTAYEPYRHV